MTDDTRPIALGPGEGETIESPLAGRLTYKARGGQTNGTITAFEVLTPPGSGPPLHTHAQEDETIYVLEGDVRFTLNGEITTMPEGSFVFVPQGVAHTWQVVGAEPARMLVIFNPAGMEGFFDRFAALTSPDPDAFRTIGAQAGMDVVGPPLAQSDPL